MSAGALALWWTAFAAANALLLCGWALQGIAFAEVLRVVFRGWAIRRPVEIPFPLVEVAAGGFVLAQVGAVAALILLDMKGS